MPYRILERGVLERTVEPGRPVEQWPAVPTGVCEALEVPLGPGLAALDALARLGRRTAPVAADGDRLLVLLAPGSAEEVPGILGWLGWSHLDGQLKTRPIRCAAVPDQAVPTRAELPRLLDALAHACARAHLDGTVSRAPSRRPRGGRWAPGPGR